MPASNVKLPQAEYRFSWDMKINANMLKLGNSLRPGLQIDMKHCIPLVWQEVIVSLIPTISTTRRSWDFVS